MLPRWLVVTIVCLVTILWSANVAVGWYDPSRGVAGLNWIFGLVVGGTLAADKPIARGIRRIGGLMTGTVPDEAKEEER